MADIRDGRAGEWSCLSHARLEAGRGAFEPIGSDASTAAHEPRHFLEPLADVFVLHEIRCEQGDQSTSGNALGADGPLVPEAPAAEM